MNNYIIRHAQSIANIGVITSDASSIGLSEKGIIQSQNLAENRNIPIKNIIHSKYDRTLLTAKPLIDKYPEIQVIQNDWIHEFTFLDPSIFADTGPAERKPHREYFWEQGADYQQGPNSESFVDFINRVNKFANEIRSGKIKDSAIFSHEQFIITLLYILQSNDKLDDLNYSKRQLHQMIYTQNMGIKNTQIIKLDDIIKNQNQK